MVVSDGSRLPEALPTDQIQSAKETITGLLTMLASQPCR